MEKIEQIINKIKKSNKSISFDDLIDFKLAEEDCEIVMEALKKSGITIEFNLIEEEKEKEYVVANDSVKQYLNEIGKIPVLTPEEEKTLFLEYIETKNPKIKEKIAQSNLKLVVSIAKHYCNKTRLTTIDFLDLIQDGNEGLMKAIDKYDVTLGYKFSTYASWWIRQGITRAISSVAKTIRIPVHMIEFSNKIKKYINEETIKTGDAPTIKEIADHFKVTEEKINNVLDIVDNVPVSLEEKITEESNATILDYTADEGVNIENDYIKDEIFEELRNTIREILTPREYKIISCRFGIINEVNDCSLPMTLEQVGDILGVTRERIRQIEAKAFRKIRIYEKSQKIKKLKK